jgi:hypothetical protein
MHKISEFALPAALILAGVGGLGWVATSTHARLEPRPSAQEAPLSISCTARRECCMGALGPLGPCATTQDERVGQSGSRRSLIDRELDLIGPRSG